MIDNIVILKCGSEVGTAFYVGIDMLLTAYHTIATRTDGDQVTIKGKEGVLSAEVFKKFPEYDIALIKVIQRIDTSYLPLLSHKVRLKEEFVSYGFPDQTSEEGLIFEGRAIQKSKSIADIKMQSGSAYVGVRYDGMSGAPVFIDDNVCGVVLEQIGQDIQFISIEKIIAILQKEGISVQHDEDITILPNELQANVDNSQPNYEVFDLIDESLQHIGKWHLLHGSPGCGKTTLAASYVPEDDRWIVLGRYFLKVPGDNISSTERRSERHFLDWLESIYIKKTGADISILSLEEKLKRLPIWLNELSQNLLEEDKNGVIIIDGLDELFNNGSNHISDFLNIINLDMPKNLTVLLSCTSKDILPEYIIRELPTDNCIEVTALEIVACEQYISENSGEWDKPYSFIQEVAHKSGGHPLYMNYLCKYIATEFNAETKEEKLHEWVETLPSIGGNIETYYNAIWKKVNIDGVAVELLAILSLVRGRVTEAELTGMISPHNLFAFSSSIEHLRFLLKDQEQKNYEIYHNSFSIYLSSQLPKRTLKSVNDSIASFCMQNSDTVYAIENELHHVVNGTNVLTGLQMCNQAWADKCAMLDLSPDMILQDIRGCLAIAVDECLPIEVARIMLLAQRIECRYDIMFVQNASMMADINLAMRKPDAVLRYLIRENTLLVSEMNGVKYLQLLYDCGFKEQARILYDAIEAKCRKKLHVKNGESIDLQTFVAKGAAQIQLLNEGRGAEEKLLHVYEIYARFKAMNQEHGMEDNAKAMSYVQSIVLSMHFAFNMRHGKTPNFDRQLDMLQVDWNEDLMIIAFRALYLYKEMGQPVVYMDKNDSYYGCLTQLETKLDEYKFTYSRDDLNWILNIMMADSKRSDLTKELINQCNPKNETLQLRKSNGVDVDWDRIVHVYENLWYIGYKDNTDNYPIVNEEYWSSEDYWETYIVALIKRIAYLQGQLSRKKADSVDLSSDYLYLKEVVDKISFSFETRSQWNRSYQIPEVVFPYLYGKITTLYRDFFADKLRDLMTHIIGRSNSQLSLYREGYVDSLYNVAERFTEYRTFTDETKVVADRLHEFILYGVLNRYERTPALLRLVNIYSLIGDKSCADATYQEMLDTSMGPGWYKEAQMGMLNKFADYGLHLTADQTAHFAAILEEAAGELTFQRYVQQEQNQFVGNLAKAGSIADAIAYYKYETLPPCDVIKDNAEGWNVDMPKVGDGYNLGANHLIEASALHFLLEEATYASPYVVYALNELFWDNDDNFRYGMHYAKLHKLLFERLDKDASIIELVPRMAEYFVGEYVSKDEYQYLNYLIDYGVDDDILDALQKELLSKGFDWKRKVNNKESEIESESLRARLRSLPTLKNILSDRKQSMINPLSEYWYTLDEMLDLIVEKMDDNTEDLCNVILDHFDLVVRPSEKNRSRFAFMKGFKEDENQDELLIHLLIWFLAHPIPQIAMRAKKALLWLVKYENRVIECLINETLNPSEIGLPTMAMEVLKDITKVSLQSVADNMLKNGNAISLSSIENFSVSKNLYEIGGLLASSVGYEDLQDVMASIIPDACADRGDTWFNDIDMMFIEHKINELNDLQVLGSSFARQYLAVVQPLCKNGGLENMIRSDMYVRRSFFINNWASNRYDRMMMNAINKALYGVVDKARLDRVYYIINS